VHGADLSSCSGAGVNYSRSYPLCVPSRPLQLARLLMEILFFLYNITARLLARFSKAVL